MSVYNPMIHVMMMTLVFFKHTAFPTSFTLSSFRIGFTLSYNFETMSVRKVPLWLERPSFGPFLRTECIFVLLHWSEANFYISILLDRMSISLPTLPSTNNGLPLR